MNVLLLAPVAIVILPFLTRILTGSDKLALLSIVAVITFLIFR